MPSGALLALALACVAPLFAGGVTRGGMLVVELAAFAAAIAATLTDRAAPSAAKRLAAWIAAIGAIGLLQWIPLPAGVVGAISPAADDAWSAAAAALAAEGSPLPAFRLSIAPRETLAVSLLAFACAAIVWAAAALPSKWIAEVFVVAGLLQVLLGSFVVSNHDAAFLLMPLAIAIGIARTTSGTRRRWSIVAAAVFATAILITGSRGGIAAAAAATLFLLLWNGRAAVLAVSSALGAAAAIAAAILIGDPRASLWSHSIAAWRRFPILGSGLGSFADAFSLGGAPAALGVVPHAHNGLLQLAVTGGAVCAGAALAAAALVAFTRFPRTALGYGAAGATLALAIHGSIDFTFSLPAITASYLCIVGAALPENLAETET